MKGGLRGNTTASSTTTPPSSANAAQAAASAHHQAAAHQAAQQQAAAAAVAQASGGISQQNSNGAGGQNGPSHEVLANFFQSLLSKKASSGGQGGQSPTGTGSPGSSLLNGSSPVGQPNGRSEDPTSYRRPAITRKDVHKELDRMRQYTASSK
jgi:dynein light intermediate chain 1